MEDKVTLFGEYAHMHSPIAQRMYNMACARFLDPISGVASRIYKSLTTLDDCCSLYMNEAIKNQVRYALVEMIQDGMQGCLHMLDFEYSEAEELANNMTDLYARKNRDYGNSFDKSMDKFGLVVSAIRIGDKVNRLQSLIAKRGQAEVKDESLADTFIDLACYAIMTLMWLDSKGNKE